METKSAVRNIGSRVRSRAERAAWAWSPHGDAIKTGKEFEALWTLLSAPPPDLVALHDDLLAVADVATPAGHEVLLARDDARALDRELSAEDCAVMARLEHAALFDAARPQVAGQAQTKSFASFQSKSPRPFLASAARDAEFDRRMSIELDARGRSTHFQRHTWRSGTELHMELVYGRLSSARDLIAKVGQSGDRAVHAITAQVTDRTTERAHAVFHDDTFRLDVAGYDWMKELVRRVFSEAYFDSAQHFEGDETITLAPLVDLGVALSTAGVPGLDKVELQELWIDLGGEKGDWIAVGARGNCMGGTVGGYARRALSEGRPCEATFLLTLKARPRPLKLKLVPPRKMEFDRRSPLVVRLVRDWVVASGFMSLPEHLRAFDAAGPAVVSERGAP